MQAVIMAGGKGTRLSSLTNNEIPKPMVPLCGKPLLLWQIEQLGKYGFDDIIMVTGFLGDKISEYFGDGSNFGCRIRYIKEETPLGTAGAFALLKEYIDDENFLFVFGDLFFDFDISRMRKFHFTKNSQVTLVAHPNIHPYDSDLVVTDKEDHVTAFDSKNNVRDYWYDNLVNAGIYFLSKSVLDKVSEPVKTDFEKDVLAAMIANGEPVYAYRTPEFIRDVGTVDRIEKTTEDINSGIAAAKNLSNKQKCIFLDRDGVINREVGFLHDIDDFELLPGAADAIKKINASGYLAVIVTNQPVIARGELTFEGLYEIFRKLKTLLGREGAFVDDIYFCPHHPKSGFEGEVKELKIHCNCRKPAPGMIFRAVEKYNIDFDSSWMIGDMTSDIELAHRAGVRSVLVETGMAGSDGQYPEAVPTLTAANIADAVDKILS